MTRNFTHTAEGGLDVGGTGRDGRIDLWLGVPTAEQLTTSQSRKDWPDASRAPQLWALLDEFGREMVCTLALECLAAEPGIDGWALGGRVNVRLAERAEQAEPAERSRLRKLQQILAHQPAWAPDVATRIRARGDLRRSLIAQREQISALIDRLGGAK